MSSLRNSSRSRDGGEGEASERGARSRGIRQKRGYYGRGQNRRGRRHASSFPGQVPVKADHRFPNRKQGRESAAGPLAGKRQSTAHGRAGNQAGNHSGGRYVGIGPQCAIERITVNPANDW